MPRVAASQMDVSRALCDLHKAGHPRSEVLSLLISELRAGHVQSFKAKLGAAQPFPALCSLRLTLIYRVSPFSMSAVHGTSVDCCSKAFAQATLVGGYLSRFILKPESSLTICRSNISEILK